MAHRRSTHRRASPSRPTHQRPRSHPRSRLRRARHARPVLPDPGAAHRAEHGERARARAALDLGLRRLRRRCSSPASSRCSSRAAWPQLLIARQPDAARRLARAVDLGFDSFAATVFIVGIALIGAGLLGAPGRPRPPRCRAAGAPSRFAASAPILAPVALGFIAVYPLALTWRHRRVDQVDRQFRHPDPHLHHARLGPEHRRRPRRPARSRLRRLLRGRRLLLRAARHQGDPGAFPALGVWAFWICLPISGLLAAFWGILLGFPVLRLRGDYLAIVTLAFGEIIRLVLINWVDFSERLCRHLGDPAPELLRHSVQRVATRASPPCSGWSSARSTARSSSTTSSCAWRC